MATKPGNVSVTSIHAEVGMKPTQVPHEMTAQIPTYLGGFFGIAPYPFVAQLLHCNCVAYYICTTQFAVQGSDQ
jgi:hypothetical protein